MDFIRDLHEARMTRNSSNHRILTYTDCCERLYLSMLVLEVLRRFPFTAGYAVGYAKKTSGYDSYKHFRMNGSDLYNFVYFVNGDDDAIRKLKDPGSAKQLRAKTSMPLFAFNRWVSTLATGGAPKSNDQETFMKIENALRITNSDYKAVRRNVFKLESLSTPDKKKTITRLILASRAKLRSSDIIEYLEELNTRADIETPTVKDTEPTVSMPDIAPEGKDLANYRFIVGTKNLMLTKKFLELAKDGKPIPGQMVQAYMPAIEMIDDIVKAGPAYIQMLRAVQNRAKKYSK